MILQKAKTIVESSKTEISLNKLKELFSKLSESGKNFLIFLDNVEEEIREELGFLVKNNILEKHKNFKVLITARQPYPFDFFKVKYQNINVKGLD